MELRTPLEQQLTGPGKTQATPVDTLVAARRRFLKGERVDMSELAGELGIGRATLYRWVGSREQLLGEVLWSITEFGIRQCKEEAQGATGAEWVLDVNRRFGELTANFEPLRRFIDREPEVALRVMTSKHSPHPARVINAFREILEEAASTRGLQLRLDAPTLAFVLVRVGESFLWADLITGEAPDLSKAQEAIRVLLTS